MLEAVLVRLRALVKFASEGDEGVVIAIAADEDYKGDGEKAIRIAVMLMRELSS